MHTMQNFLNVIQKLPPLHAEHVEFNLRALNTVQIFNECLKSRNYALYAANELLLLVFRWRSIL